MKNAESCLPLTVKNIMLKKILAIAATSLFSLDASAGYIQYNFNGPITGSVVQHDDDQSIAYYRLSVPVDFGLPDRLFSLSLTPLFGEGSTRITKATTYFTGNGPSNFSIFSDFGADQTTSFSIDFAGATSGNLVYKAQYDTSVYFSDGYRHTSGTYNGLVTASAVDPQFAQGLDSNGGYYDGMSPVVPKFIGASDVPEPATLALFVVGALGLTIAARSRKGM